MALITLETKAIEFNEKQREFIVVDRNIGSPAPKYFISYNNGSPFISDEVPEDYRKPMVFHELTEFELLQNKTDKCLNALLAELKTIPKNKRKDYFEFRREVFENLISFLEEYQSNSSLIPEVRKSLNHLKNNFPSSH
ncbi:MAG: hypothetical protein AABX83_00380 [Nanoarchaeota archaeon]